MKLLNIFPGKLLMTLSLRIIFYLQPKTASKSFLCIANHPEFLVQLNGRLNQYEDDEVFWLDFRKSSGNADDQFLQMKISQSLSYFYIFA